MACFRTIRISDARFERDNLRVITVKTPNLKGRGDICVFVPPGLRPNDQVPIVMLLHGVYGSAWSWAYSGGVHLQAFELIRQGEIAPMIIAMPSDGLWGDGSGYLPHQGLNFENWIAFDVPAVVAQAIPGASDTSPLFLAGLSMGGFGALRIGAKYGTRFRGIAGHSSITSLPQMKLFVEEDISAYQQPQPADEDLLATFLQYRAHLPPIRFDCGSSDQLIEPNRTLHRQLEEQGIPHGYEEHPGGHEWAYWEKHIGTTLRFFSAQLA